MLKKGLLTLALFVTIFFFTRNQTDGFTESKIYREQDSFASNGKPLKVLNQRFSYLGRGAQSFSLISEDGQYVLKFFRKDRASHPLKPLRFLFPPFAKRRLDQTLKKRDKRRLKAFNSYQIAFQKVRKETCLLELRLNPFCDQILDFTDKIGVVHHFSLAGVPFLLQRCAAPFYPTLLGWIKEGEIEKVKQSLSELTQLLCTRCKKGIFDKDPDLQTNFGWIDRHPIQIDVGRFSFDETRKDPEIYRRDLIRITDRLCKWLDSHCPPLASYLRQEVETL